MNFKWQRRPIPYLPKLVKLSKVQFYLNHRTQETRRREEVTRGEMIVAIFLAFFAFQFQAGVDGKEMNFAFNWEPH